MNSSRLNASKNLYSTVALAVFLMAIIVMMILPVPSWLLDLGLALSFGAAILIFATTLFIDRPLDFSSFPTILLASLVLRLSLNVSSTKLIIGDGHKGSHAAGYVIEGFSNFVMRGNIFLGIVIFLVLLIVNFIVITKGATRMAEVSARFALDAMPGKQLAIDADMSAGAIDHTEARRRREHEQAETTFFGSLDGASKFVKGDAIAGLLITLMNLCMGVAVGAFVHGMSFSDAFTTYSILTVGDGLVTQLPAVIIAIATALLLAKGGTSGPVDLALVTQLSRHPKSLATVGTIMGFLALVPGLPFVPFILGSIVVFSLSYFATLRTEPETPQEMVTEITKPREKSMGDLLDLDEIHVEFSPDLVVMALDPATGLETRIRNMRSFIASNYGLILPEIRLTDNASLQQGGYRIRLHGVIHAEDIVKPDSILALLPSDSNSRLTGEVVKEPVYSVPAKWISRAQKDEAILEGCTLVTPEEILATHLLEVVKSNCEHLLTIRGLHRLLDEFTNLTDETRNEQNKQILDDLIPEKVSVETLHQVLQLLLSEQVSIRNLPLILESIAEARLTLKSADDLCEHVRRRLGPQLTKELLGEDGKIPLIGFSPHWETHFADTQDEQAPPTSLLAPDQCETLISRVKNLVKGLGEKDIDAGIVTSSKRRRFVRSLLKSRDINVPVFSFDEVASMHQIRLVGTLEP